MNLHAATTADGRDRKQLERICRYLLRPPFAHDAVTALPDGRVRVSFKAPWRSAATAAARAGLRPPRRPARFLAQFLAPTPTHRLGPAPRPRLRYRHHPLPKMRRPHACPRGGLRCRRHRQNSPRRPRSASTSSSRTGPVVRLPARPTGDVLTLLRPAVVVAVLLGPMSVRFLMPRLTRASPRAQDPANSSRPRAPRCSPGRSVLTRAPKFPLQNA